MGDSNYDRAAALIPDEKAAISYFTKIRWQHGYCCPYCGKAKLRYSFHTGAYRCIDGGQVFSVKVGTLFEDTKLPMRTWLLAIAYVLDHSGAATSSGLAKTVGVPQKRAWYMLERLRHGIAAPSFGRPLPADSTNRPDGSDAKGRTIKSVAKREEPTALDPALQAQVLEWEDEMVEGAFRDFPRPYGGTSLWHPASESRAREFIKQFEGQGSEFNAEAVYRWARRHELDVDSAKLLRSIVREPRRTTLRHRKIADKLTLMLKRATRPGP